jgi:hypothetical protein
MLLMLRHADRAVNRITTVHAHDPERKPDDGVFQFRFAAALH